MSRKLRKQDIDGTVETMLLSVLGDRPSYGYAIVKELNARADGLLEFGEGTVYPILHRLEEKGFLQASWEETESKRRRKYYAVTPKGKAALDENLQRWQLLAVAMDRIAGFSKNNDFKLGEIV